MEIKRSKGSVSENHSLSNYARLSVSVYGSCSVKNSIIKHKSLYSKLPLQILSKKASIKPNASIQDPSKSLENLCLSAEKSKSLSKVELMYSKFMEENTSISCENTKFQEEFRYCIKSIKKVSKFIQPFSSILEMIAEGLSKYSGRLILQEGVEDIKQREKLIQKLKVLSTENIEFYKKNEDLKREIKLLRKSIVFNQTANIVEKLLIEIESKTSFISKYKAEINEYKNRETHLLKLLEKRTQTITTGEESVESINNTKSTLQRSASIKCIPKINTLSLQKHISEKVIKLDQNQL